MIDAGVATTDDGVVATDHAVTTTGVSVEATDDDFIASHADEPTAAHGGAARGSHKVPQHPG